MFVEYVLRGRKSVRGARAVMERCIIDVEDERDEGERRYCKRYAVTKEVDDEIHVKVDKVDPSWWPGECLERMLRKALHREGCELELVQIIH